MNDIKKVLQMFRMMSAILDKKQKHKIRRLFVVIFIGALFELLGVTALLPFMQAVLEPEKLLKNPYVFMISDMFNVKTGAQLIVLVSCFIILVYIIKNLFLIWSAYLQAMFSCNTQKELSVLMLESYIDHPYSFFLNNNSGDILRGVNQDVEGVYRVITHFFKFLAEGLTAVLIITGLLITDPGMAIGVVLAGGISLILIVFFLKKKINRLGIVFRETMGIKNRYVYETVTGIKDVFVYDKKKYFLNAYSNAYEAGAKASAYYNFANACPERIIEAICVLGIVIIVLIRINSGIDSTEFVAKLGVFAMAAFRLMPSFTRIAGNINEFIYSRPSVEATYRNIISARNYLNRISEETDNIKEEVEKEFDDCITVQGISWKYEEGLNNVLEDLNMHVSKGEAIGIVGESGSGKSTLSDILLHLYRPDSGTITMDGVDINSIPRTWNRCIGYVPQRVFLLDSTVRDNVAFGEKSIDDDRVWKALKQARLKQFVEELPDGLDTIVGERGVKFSGGQVQRIAIARALYFEPQILILDEATSALDTDTEKAVMDAIDSLHGDITLLIIAHRLSTIRNCDRVYEITGGKAIERKVQDVVDGQ
ncbi:MAG: ABC transporter ATP-binding protein/permease [Lachnospiraceae bacterium]|nr:ABC transporter ATP-binding protein/permease [Lachnospiraceae bacterium]